MRELHLGVDLDGAGHHPAAWREPGARPKELFTPDYYVDLVQRAERGTLDFVTIDDSFALQTGRDRRARAASTRCSRSSRVAPTDACDRAGARR